MAISANEHKSHITNTIIGRFSDYSPPKMGLSVFFPPTITTSKKVSIEVRRGRKLMAADVQRGRGGNINKFTSYNEKLYIPPFYEEKFDLTESEVYDVTYGQDANPNTAQAGRMIEDANEKLEILRDTIELAKENQRAEALQTGIVGMENGDNVDYKRKAASIKVLTGTAVWNDDTSDPLQDLETGIKFCRQEGKSATRRYNLIMGSEAYPAFRDHKKIKEFADIRNMTIIDLGQPEFNDVTGLTYQGRLYVTNGAIDLWTYDEFYEDKDGNNIELIDSKNVILLPSDFIGRTAHAGVPAILRDQSKAEFSQFIQQTASQYHINNYIDPNVMAHWFKIYSAPLALPFSIDRLFTIKVLA